MDPMFMFVDWSDGIKEAFEYHSLVFQDYKVKSRPHIRSRLPSLGWIEIEGRFKKAVRERKELKFIIQMGLLYGFDLQHHIPFDSDIMDILYPDGESTFVLTRAFRFKEGYEVVRKTIDDGISAYTKSKNREPYNLQGIIDGLNALSPVTRRRAQIAFIRGLGLQDLAGYDGELLELLKSLPPGLTYSEIRQQLCDLLMEKLIVQIRNNGPTLFLDTERLLSYDPTCVEYLIHRRREEIEETYIYKGNFVNLRPLWYSSWGYEILDALEVGMVIKPSQYDMVKERFRSIGVQFKVVTDSSEFSTPVKISGTMKDAIDWIIRAKELKSNPKYY